MARNGTGTYSLPPTSWNPAVSGGVIESTAANTTLTDIAAALTQSISKDGQTVWVGNDNHGGFKLINLADGSTASDSMTFGQGVKLAGGNTYTGAQIYTGSVTIVSSASGSAKGPMLDIYRNASSSVGYLLGGISLTGNNEVNAKLVYAEIGGKIQDPTSTLEIGNLVIRTVASGSLTETAAFLPNGADIIFYDSGANSGPTFTLRRVSATAAASDAIGEINFEGSNTTPAQTSYARIAGSIDNPAPGLEAGRILFQTVRGGTRANRLNVGAGVFVGSATGGDLGAGAFNAQSISINSVPVGFYSTFTPALAFGGAAVGLTYGSRSGSYIQTGNRVSFTINITLTAKGSSTGAATVTGLPVTSAAGNFVSVQMVGISNMSGLTVPCGTITVSTTSIDLRQQAATGISSMTEANFANTSTFIITGTYEV